MINEQSTNSNGRVYNFSAGPAPIFPEVIDEASRDVISYKNSRVSILELGHRTKVFTDLERRSSEIVKEVLEVPDGYEVLWMQGGATAMFASVVYNFYLGPEHPVCFIVSGNWSNLALKEALKLGARCEIIKKCGVDDYPQDFDLADKMDIIKSASYVYYCDNETVTGFEFPAAGSKSKDIEWLYDIPDSVPIICDMTSNIATRKFDVSKYSVIFAGAQKNIATSGVTLTLVKKDDLKRYKSLGLSLSCPSILDMDLMLKNYSAYNTPPVFQISLCEAALNHFKKIGGLEYLEQKNKKLVSLVEETVKSSNGFYRFLIKERFRSRMNMVLNIFPNGSDVNDADAEREAVSLASTSYNIIGINGHRSFGGIRISLYNAVEVEHTKKLCTFLVDFMRSKA